MYDHTYFFNVFPLNSTFLLLKIQRFEALNSFTVINLVRIEFDGKIQLKNVEKRYAEFAVVIY